VWSADWALDRARGEERLLKELEEIKRSPDGVLPAPKFTPEVTFPRRRSVSSAEVPRTGGKVGFEGTRIPARSSGVMTIDLSQAYDISVLERPLASGYYFLVLTNNGFAFGQDWQCSVDFCKQSV
jgi:hypothetical protein